jgi:hypothetical protein
MDKEIPSTQDMLREIAQKMAVGGYNPNKAVNPDAPHYCIPEFLINGKGLEALFKRDDMCTRPKEGGCCMGDPGCADCRMCLRNQEAYVYHGMQSAKIMLSEGEEAAIKYVYEEMMK